MTTRRQVFITEGAYAILREMKRGDLKWKVTRTGGMVELEVDGDVYDGLLEKMREWKTVSISATIIHAYRMGPAAEGTLGGGPLT